MTKDLSANSEGKLSLKEMIYVFVISFIYLIASAFLIDYKIDQLVLVIIFNALYFSSYTTRRLALGFLIFIVFWVIFDFMKTLPNYLFNSVHIEDLYLREKKWFGITENGVILTPNEYANSHSKIELDVLSGFFYINWVPIPLLFACYLFKKNKLLFLKFSLSFLLVNLIGFVIYYLYPAAPPWYVKEFGFELNIGTPGNTAGLKRFDEFFNVTIFHSLYSKSSNVFAAMPSLHSAYPVIIFYYALKNRLWLLSLFFFIFMIGIWFSAVYTGHHYVQDVLAGALCAITGILVFNFMIMKITYFKLLIYKYRDTITEN